MSQVSINEIERMQTKRKHCAFGLLVLFILFFFTLFFVPKYVIPRINPIYYPLVTKYFPLLILSLGIAFLFVLSSTPILSTLDLVRFHLNRLVLSLQKGDHKKIIYHLNKLAYNTEILDGEFEDYMLLGFVQKKIHGFFQFLKSEAYPSFERRVYNDEYMHFLEDVNNLIESQNIDHLSELLSTPPLSSEIKSEEVLLPYEKPNPLFSFLNTFKSNLLNIYANYPIFKGIFLFSIFSFGGYAMCLKIPSIKFDSVFISGILMFTATLVGADEARNSRKR